MKFFAPEKLGRKQSLTPEGFLLCEEVGLARVGEMIYAPGEVPLKEGPDNIIHVDRDAAEVFRAEFVASLNGKPIVDEHPSEDVTPENWERYAVGVTLNPRRGLAAEDDILFGDLLITRRSAIRAVQSGKREISVGYDADYEQTGVGRGRQTNMIANHVALVESGRCGPRCAIGDRNPTKRRTGMTLDELKQRVIDAFRKKDESAVVAALEDLDSEARSSATHIHIHTKDANPDPGENEKGKKEGAEAANDPDPSAHDDKRSKGKDDDDDRRGKAKDDDDDDRRKAKDDDDKKKSKDDDKVRHRFTDAEISERFENLENGLKEVKDSLKKFGKAKDDDDRRGKAKDDDDDRRGKAKDDDDDDDRKKAKDADIEVEIPPGAAKTTDSAPLEEAFQQTISLCEVIAPGMAVEQFDRKLSREKTYDTICTMRRTALDLAYQQPETRGLLDEMLKGRKVRDLACSEARAAFASVAAFKRRANNGELARTVDTNVSGPSGSIRTPADLNKRLQEFYKQ